jgi:outer membrane protein insertion porin family
LVGLSTIYDDTDGIHPTRGQRFVWGEDFAGLGGDVRYIRSSVNATKYHSLGGNWILSFHAEGGYVAPLQKAVNADADPVRLNDRFFDPGLRGFDIRGIGPRVIRIPYTSNGTLAALDLKNDVTDAIGGRAYYMGRIELEFPVSSGLKSMGLRPSAFVDIGSLWKVKQPQLLDVPFLCTDSATGLSTFASPKSDCSVDINGTAHTGSFTSAPGFREVFYGNSAKPRLTVGIGVNWVSPFGPLRIDLAKALLKQKGDDTKIFNFNVGTQF